MRLQIKLLDSTSVWLNGIESSDTLEAVKGAIFVRLRIPVEDQELRFNGQPMLRAGATLADFNIHKDDCLFLLCSQHAPIDFEGTAIVGFRYAAATVKALLVGLAGQTGVPRALLQLLADDRVLCPSWTFEEANITEHSRLQARRVMLPSCNQQLYRPLKGSTASWVLYRRFACKSIPLLPSSTEADENKVLSELDIVKDIHHPGVIKYHSHRILGERSTTQRSLQLVMDFCETSLGMLQGAPAPHLMFTITTQAVSTLAMLHGREPAALQHMNIKPDNICLVSGLSNEACGVLLKFVDFGMADNTLQSISSERGGTRLFWSPERTSGLRFNHADDVWALGLTLLYVGLGMASSAALAQEQAACGSPGIETYQERQLQLVSAFKDRHGRVMGDVVSQMLARDAESRITAQEAQLELGTDAFDGLDEHVHGSEAPSGTLVPFRRIGGGGFGVVDEAHELIHCARVLPVRADKRRQAAQLGTFLCSIPAHGGLSQYSGSEVVSLGGSGVLAQEWRLSAPYSLVLKSQVALGTSLATRPPPSRMVMPEIALQLLDALAALHSHVTEIAAGNVCPENVLVESTLESVAVTLVGYGINDDEMDTISDVRRTPSPYWSPARCEAGSGCSLADDAWSAGLTLLYSGSRLACADNLPAVTSSEFDAHVTRLLSTFQDQYGARLASIVEGLVRRDIAQRLTVLQARALLE